MALPSLSQPVAAPLNDNMLMGLAGPLVHERFALHLHAEIVKHFAAKYFSSSAASISPSSPHGAIDAARINAAATPPPGWGGAHPGDNVASMIDSPGEQLWCALQELGRDTGRRITERLLLRNAANPVRRAKDAKIDAMKFVRERLWPAVFGRLLGPIKAKPDRNAFVLHDVAFRWTRNLSCRIQQASLAVRATPVPRRDLAAAQIASTMSATEAAALLSSNDNNNAAAAATPPAPAGSAADLGRSGGQAAVADKPGPRDYCVVITGIVEGCLQVLGLEGATVAEVRLEGGDLRTAELQIKVDITGD